MRFKLQLVSRVMLVAFLALELILGSYMIQESHASESKQGVKKSCAASQNQLVGKLSQEDLEVTVTSSKVMRVGNPTSRKESLLVVVGPSKVSTKTVDEATKAWEIASRKVAFANILPLILPVVKSCPDIAQVSLGLAQSDFIREVVVVKNTPLGIKERTCAVEEEPIAWSQQICL